MLHETEDDINKAILFIEMLKMEVMEMDRNITKKSGVPVWEKYALTICEASRFFGIGEKKLRQLVKRNPRAGFIIWNGNRVLIKRMLFEEFLNDSSSL